MPRSKSKKSKRLQIADCLASGETAVTIKKQEHLKKHPMLDMDRPCNQSAKIVGIPCGMRGLYYILQIDVHRLVYHIDDFWIPLSEKAE